MRVPFRLVVFVLLATAVAASAYLFVWPREDTPAQADAVVVLSGSRVSRLARGLELMRQGVAPTLVVSDGRARGWREGNRLCSGRVRFEVLCFRPDPYSTAGEAEAVARLATDRRWRSIVVVTSTYHVTRSRLLFERCSDRRIDVVSAETSPSASLRNIPFEWGKLVYQLTVQRDC